MVQVATSVPRAVAVLALLLALAGIGLAPRQVAAVEPGEEAARLLEGVQSIARPGVPGTLTVFGPTAFPIVAGVAGGRPVPLVAATREGRGRAVLFGHTYTGDALAVGDTARLVANVLAWAAGGRRKVRVGVRGGSELGRHLPDDRFTVTSLDGGDWLRELDDVDVLVIGLGGVGEKDVEELRDRLRAGLGIVSGMPGWGWQQLNPGKDLRTENGGNRLLAPYGLMWGSDTIEGGGSPLAIAGPAPSLTQASRALEALTAKRHPATGEDAALALATAMRALRDVPPDDRLFLPDLDAWARRQRKKVRTPSHDAPLTDADAIDKLVLARQVLQGLEADAKDVEAHAAADAFPGEVPRSAKAVRVSRVIDLAVPDWHGTGVYARPGEVIKVRCPKDGTPAGLQVRIGAHTDRLWDKAAWHRAPEVSRAVALEPGTVQAASAFGGLVYIVVPRGLGPGTLEVDIDGAVAAPHFVLGTTGNEAWRSTLRNAPAPWAELETTKVILTVPSAFVRELDDPEALMRWWDRVMDACADLSAIPRERARPERYVTDEQISAGYMHAGYPIMTHLDAAPRFVDLPVLSTRGDWGMFHEMGHNHQHADWTFDGTVEVTCNLYSLYVLETVCTAGERHEAMSAESMARATAKYRQGRKDFGVWKANPFTALIVYDQLREAFGWDAYKKVFAEYAALPPPKRPADDDDKRDQWLMRMSRTVGHDLTALFDLWGIPVSDAAKASVKGLPTWLPPSDR